MSLTQVKDGDDAMDDGACMQTETLNFRDVVGADVRQAFPLAQATGTAAALDDWIAFATEATAAKSHRRHGIRALVNDQGTYVGLMMFTIANDPRHVAAFEITHLLALNRVTAEALLKEAVRLAEANGCALMRAAVSVGDMWLGDFLRRRGFTLERHLLACPVKPRAS